MMEPTFVTFAGTPLFLLLIAGLFVLLLVGLLILLAARKRPPSPSPMPAAPVPISPEERQAILQKLADGELTKAEAEEQLNQLGTPVPVSMPAPPRSGASKGCLIALIAALVLPLILLVGAIALFYVRVRTSQEDILQNHIEHVERMQRQFEHEQSRRNQ